MKAHTRSKTLIDLEKLNMLNTKSCPACGRKFQLGELVLLACGNWEGERYIHGDEATLNKKTNSYYERRYYEKTFAWHQKHDG